MAKIFLDLAKGIVALILWQDATTDCVKPKTNMMTFEVTRQNKISHWANIAKGTITGQLGWSTEVIEM